MFAGCLVDDDLDVAIALDDLAFTLDTAGWSIDVQKAGALLETDCAAAPAVCSGLIPGVCPGPSVCSAVCGLDQRCELRLDVRLRREVNIAAATPALAMSSGATTEVAIDELTYAVAANSLDVDAPPLTLSVATTAISEQHAIGEIAAIGAGTTVASRPVAFTGDGESRLAATIGKYRTPFNLVIDSHLTVHRGEPIPQGRLDLTLGLRARAER